VIAFLIIVYVAVVLVLFKFLHIKPTAYIIAAMIVAGVFLIGSVVVVWTQSAPITDKMVTSQYVVQLVPYVKGQVKTIYAQANQPTKKGDLLLEIAWDRKARSCERSSLLQAQKRLVLACPVLYRSGVPYRIRTGVAAVRGRCPGPLDEGDEARWTE
jgi:multidrug resistance efflux pump